MSDEVVVELLKELVTRLQTLEQTVYDSDNVLMKSGFVRVNSPTPSMSNSGAEGLPDSDTLAKMEWSEINDLMARIGGQ